MASGRLIDYLGSGTLAERPATPDLHAGTAGIWFATDTGTLSVWDGTAWNEGTGVLEVMPGTNVTVDASDPQRPIVSATGGGGGGAARGYGSHRLKRTGRFFIFGDTLDRQGVVASGLGPNADQIWYVPFTMDVPRTYSGLAFNSGTGSGRYQLGIYANDDSSGEDRPGSLIVRTNDMIYDGTQIGSITPTTLNPGEVYWAAYCGSSGALSVAALQYQYFSPAWFGRSNFTGSGAGQGILVGLREDAPGWTNLPSSSSGVYTILNDNNFPAIAGVV